MGWLEQIKKWVSHSKEAQDIEKQFEESARKLLLSCRESCETSDEFIAFVSALLSELTGVRHTVDGLKSLPLTSKEWSISETVNEQLPLIRSVIVSVTGQIQAREIMLNKNIEAISNLNAAFEKIGSQLTQPALGQLLDETQSLLKRTHQQILSIRSLSSLILIEQRSFNHMVTDNDEKSCLLN